LLFVLFVAACAPNAVVNPVPSIQLDQQARIYPEKEYIIAAGDTIDVKFRYNPEFNELALPVRPDGRISLQLVPDIKVSGLTPSELRDALTEKYAVELKNPDIVVIVRTFADQKVFVDGEVVGPCLVDLKGPTTVMRAIAQAGGMKPMATSVDLRRVIDGSDFSQDIYLMPYDIVYVPRSNIGRVDKFVDEYINKLIPGLGSPFITYYGTPSASVVPR
jgi:protein involved in polysaccharide export with SLBB domain